MKGKWRWIAAAAGLVLVAVVLMALARPKGVPVQVVEVRRGDLIVPVQCDVGRSVRRSDVDQIEK